MIDFAPLTPLVPYNAPEREREAELSTLDRGREAALKWLRDHGITEPGFKEKRRTGT